MAAVLTAVKTQQSHASGWMLAETLFAAGWIVTCPALSSAPAVNVDHVVSHSIPMGSAGAPLIVRLHSEQAEADRAPLPRGRPGVRRHGPPRRGVRWEPPVGRLSSR